ncbi:hypothetical protein MSPP1_003503 [Malassezia sp. CBS 17886]|nr:hypothetical protein MSPP1_003503 [Malassezia sp. CBS 17886]
MPKLALQLLADLQNEQHPNPVSLDPANVAELRRSSGEANLVMSCSSCRRENSASFVVRKPGGKGDAGFGEVAPWSEIVATEDGVPSWQTLCTVEFRGVAPVDSTVDSLLPDSETWSCCGAESGTPFTDVVFDDGEWHDYDEKAGDEVGITDVQLRWQKV